MEQDIKTNSIAKFLGDFNYIESEDLLRNVKKTIIETHKINDIKITKFTNEFWTSKQRQSNSIHEISYRACFKSQLPNFFIQNFTKAGDVVYDPFSGRGTTIIEAALLNRNVVSNDINPISEILCKPRLFIPTVSDIIRRLDEIEILDIADNTIDLSMFFHKETLREIISLKYYFSQKEELANLDNIDLWIRMVATNRLTGHSSGFFSVYTLPPNMAVSQESQKRINLKRNQIPEYRNTKEIIVKKTKDLIKNLSENQKTILRGIGKKSLFINCDARYTSVIKNESINLIVTSPPFLDIVQYAADNWLRCWFNDIDDDLTSRITMSKTIEDWENVMNDVFKEFYRITKNNALIAFEVGEIKNGKLNLDEYVVKIGINNGFKCIGIMINSQIFTKTANIWGIKNNSKGTNTNRIVIFQKNKL